MEVIHISFGGPVYRLACGKWKSFEDHHYCGPIFLSKAGDPLDIQPKETDPVWSHVNAWYQQGKQFITVAGERWAQYTTDRHQTLREVCAARRETRNP
jgi:hypothetical protein